MKILLLFLLTNMPCFSMPTIENALHERYSRNIARIIETKTDGVTKNSQIIQKELLEIQNGIFLLARNGSTSQGYNEFKDGIICYNIYQDNISEIRLLELIKFVSNYEIFYYDNYIEILGDRLKRVRDSSFPQLGIGWINQSIKIIFEFNETNRIKKYFIIDQNENTIDEEYLFQYDINGRLCHIFRVYDYINVLIKSIYYDGIKRTLEPPYFNNLPENNLDEIIVLENNKIKYHAIRLFYSRHIFGSVTLINENYLTNENYHISFLIEFDEEGKIYQQNLINWLEDGETSVQEIVYLEYDESGNWIQMRRHIDVYWREIEYIQ